MLAALFRRFKTLSGRRVAPYGGVAVRVLGLLIGLGAGIALLRFWH